ncbi:MAG: lipoyl synthase [Gammaproteobacteria bacterium]|nr:lipoyl synthase [Gammaproteobacteria bacterium]
MSEIITRDLPKSDYQTIWQQMHDFTHSRDINANDEIWFLEHEPVFTQGQAGRPEHLLNPGKIPVVQTNRGGQVTYHGPGQLMAYCLIDIRRRKIGVKQFVRILEQSIIDLLAEYNIEVNTRDDAPGVYVKDTKICSIGLKISRGCAYHGLALNVDMDLEPFSRINPCGFKNLTMTQIKDFVPNITIPETANKLDKILKHNLTIHSMDSAVKPRNDETRRNEAMNQQPILRKPAWIRSQLASKDKIGKVDKLLRANRLTTVCEEAACPNRGECYNCGTATFMIMGDTCTRNCKFCNVKTGRPNPLDTAEPERVAQTVKLMQLKYVVLTSVDRDDLLDGGAKHFAQCIAEIRTINPDVKIEILTPDFRGCMDNALDILANNLPDVFNHNIETAPRLYKTICPSANYELSLKLLSTHKKHFPNLPTKSGIMVGLGETDEEVMQVMQNLRNNKVDRLTIGQYLQPSIQHTPVQRYVAPEKFQEFAQIAKEMGFTHASSGPMVRSSYHADLMN